MSAWSAAVAVALVSAITYAMRAGVIVALGERALPLGIERVLRNVGPAVLAALAVNLAAGGEGGPHLETAEAVALVAAVLAAWRTRSLIAALAVGMVVLWLVTGIVTRWA